MDFLLRRGDIDDRIYNQETMQMGSKLHGEMQRKQGKEYLSEYPLSGSIVVPEGEISLQGRADGIIVGGKLPIIDEIKSTVDDLDHFHQEQGPWHEGQALVYAYLYLKEQGGEGAIIRLSYLSQRDSSLRKVVEKTYTKKQIEEKVEGFARDYLSFFSPVFAHRKERDASVKDLAFPYPSFRAGQRELAKYCFGVAKNGGVLFAEAPTGIGKTMSTLFPFVKSFQEGRVEKIFYLTAKGTGGIAAYLAAGELQQKGFKGWDSTLYSKEKICFHPGHRCNPEDCPFAKGYYTKIKDVLKETMATETHFDFLASTTLARKYGICPFEFQLDLSLFADVVICDYNYFFDPIVHLKRYFDPEVDQSKFLVLIDEAHNLIERGRSMYSSSLSSEAVEFAKKGLKGKKKQSLSKALSKIEKSLLELKDDDGDEVLESAPEDVEKALDSFHNALIKERKEQSARPDYGPSFQELSREEGRYLRLLREFPSPSTHFVVSRHGKQVNLTQSCLDASSFLKESLSRVKGAVLFSATLSPISYFSEGIIGEKDARYLLLPTPFDERKFHVMIAPKVSVRYKDRGKSYQEVASYLGQFVSAKVGNYFLYFPSYEYLESIRPFLDFKDASILVQGRKMSEEDKKAFLDSFSPNPTSTSVGLLILGGAFSEGIDLVSDRLLGVAIVGVGLPQMNFQNNLIRDYYQKKGGDGFAYAYQNPGLGKVMQALGRVIRSEDDVGAALLIDDRYLRKEARSLLERSHPSYEVVTCPAEVGVSLGNFYSKGVK